MLNKRCSLCRYPKPGIGRLSMTTIYDRLDVIIDEGRVKTSLECVNVKPFAIQYRVLGVQVAPQKWFRLAVCLLRDR